MEFALSSKAFDVKQTRQLASEITQRGAALFDALDAEHELKVCSLFLWVAALRGWKLDKPRAPRDLGRQIRKDRVCERRCERVNYR